MRMGWASGGLETLGRVEVRTHSSTCRIVSDEDGATRSVAVLVTEEAGGRGFWKSPPGMGSRGAWTRSPVFVYDETVTW